ncbi:MAG: pentapeptide repeat-containing protein [Rhodanobacteraceae bacterium]|nr:pentapeptide repeat-containing protein [Rhodanobacteraceae bacterium]
MSGPVPTSTTPDENEPASPLSSNPSGQETTPALDAAADFNQRLSQVETLVQEERRTRSLDMASQEHRLVPAAAAWLQALLHKPRDNDQFIACSKALIWCLVPSPATATISLISILGLLIAQQANRLLMLQTVRMEEQNMLAEEQRRASLMIEAGSVVEQIGREKDQVKNDEGDEAARRQCDEKRAELCWNQDLFVPTQATMWRLAALTQALRPYRYLVVDGSDAAVACDDTAEAPAPTTVSNGIFQALLQTSALGLDRAQLDAVSNQELLRLQSSAPQRWFETGWQHISTLMAPDQRSARLSCRALSPERGQLLISLHAARIDLSELAKRGATFQWADLPHNTDLSGIRLIGVDLSGANLSGAKFHKSTLRFVDFQGADLSGASFQTACLSDNNFGGALLQELGAAPRHRLQLSDAPPLFFLPTHLSFQDQMDSAWVRYRGPADAYATMCSTLATLESRVSGESTEPLVAEQALVLNQHLREHWLVEVTGTSSINGAALLRPDAIKRELAQAAPIRYRLGDVSVSLYALSACPALPDRNRDPVADRLLDKELAQCRLRLGLNGHDHSMRRM